MFSIKFGSTPEADPDIIMRVCKRFETLRKEKSPWFALYDILARYILGRRHFMTQIKLLPQDLFDAFIFDETAMNANMLMAASHVGALWPNGAKSFKITVPLEMENSGEYSDEVKKYYEFVTKRIAEVMDNPKSGFLTTFEEYMVEQGALGTSGIFVEESDDPKSPVIYRAVSARDIFIDIDANGAVDTVYIRRWMTLWEIYKEYGDDSFTDEERKFDQVSDLTPTDNTRNHEVIIAIEPRKYYNLDSRAAKDMPYASVHVDRTRNRMLKNSGYKELPVFVGRFWHVLHEKYGRSPGMLGLASIRELNQWRFDLIQAAEKLLYPPVNVVENSLIGNDTVDLSAHGINVISDSGFNADKNRKPIEMTIDVNDPKWAYQRVTELTQYVKDFFFQDRIMDLNNTQEMTAQEANIRNGLRGQSLNTVYSRQEKEILEPCIERTFNILFAKGMLGVIPGSPEEMMVMASGREPYYIPDILVDKMKKGEELYKIIFTSPASRIRQAEELQGITTVLQAVEPLANINPEILDGIDFDYTISRIAELSGAPSQMMKSQEAIQKARQLRQQQQQQAQQMQMMEQGSNVAKNAGQAAQSMQPK